MQALESTLTTSTDNQSQREVIRLEDICKYYGAGETQVTALDHINLTIQAGEYCSIMGASGSGKTTCMNIIGCLDRPSGGRYFLDGQDVSQLDDDRLAEIRNRKLGFVFQSYHLLPQLTALENVMLPMAYANIPPRQRRERAEAVLTRVGMGHRLHNRPNQLSGGQQQRVAIARALANNPVIILADEPTGALDSRTAAEVMELFGELNQSGITIVVVTHSAEVAHHAQRICLFRDGKILNPNLHPEDLHSEHFL
ncbi:MAG: ABC transporter ATP-binding protein [Pseudanabaenaceae cyanobacterium]